MKYFYGWLLLVGVVVSLSGCASDTAATSAYNSTDANGNPVSSTPWSKPESWEQGGQLGNAVSAAGGGH